MLNEIIADGHCHLAAAVTQLSQRKLAIAAITPSDIVDLTKYKKQNQLAKIGLGLHPWLITPDLDVSMLKQQLQQLIEQYSVDFIGETGLDYLKPNFELQQQVFTLHLKLAAHYQLPIVIHCVRAYNQILAILKKAPQIKSGLLHGYNANFAIAKQLWAKNIYLGIGSSIMQHNSQLVRSSAHFDLKQIIIESDAPYMPMAGNSKSNIDDCLIYATQFANYQGKNHAEIIRMVNQNWDLLFN